MIQSGSRIEDGELLSAQLVVIGAGPGGIVSAVEACRRGVDVILIETGNRRPTSHNQRLSVAHRQQPELHAPVELAVSRQVGGTSSIWGGRCVPYDPVDFVIRHTTPGSVWPVTFADVQGYFGDACDWMKCGRPVFDVAQLDHLVPNMIAGLEDGDVLTSSLERWSLPTDFGRVYYDELRDSATLRLITDATCVQIDLDKAGTRATGIQCKTLSGKGFSVVADDVIVAAGGLESTRLLMCSTAPDGKSIGDHSGHLGHWYMAHLEGVIADLVLSTPAKSTVYSHERDIDGSYVRRRFTFDETYIVKHDLPNISGWIANPELPDASHCDPCLSLTYLMLISPIGSLLAPSAQRQSLTGTKIPGAPYGIVDRSPVWRHVLNLLRHPVETVKFALNFGVKRVFSRGRKPPGFFVDSPRNRFPFQYHGEHFPHFDSHVRLSDDVDELGMRRLEIDIAFTDEDINGVIAAHKHWDDYLRSSGVGRLDYHADDLDAAVRVRTGGGFHQVGTTRMSSEPDDGVVDGNLTVHGVPNLHVVSSSTFVTSGQANSTFMIIVFALRLIDHLYGSK
jgi:GMC oxidoreductase/Pyridine nucleotide-disulphide oxidoreductase